MCCRLHHPRMGGDQRSGPVLRSAQIQRDVASGAQPRERRARGRAGASSRTAAARRRPSTATYSAGIALRGLRCRAPRSTGRRSSASTVHSHVSTCAIDRVEHLGDPLGRPRRSSHDVGGDRELVVGDEQERHLRRRAAPSVDARSWPTATAAAQRRRVEAVAEARRGARLRPASTSSSSVEPADPLAVQPVELLLGRRSRPTCVDALEVERRDDLVAASSTSSPSSAGAQPSSAR